MLESLVTLLATSDAPALERLRTQEQHSYRQLGQGVARVIRILEEQSARLGKPTLRVGIFMPNSAEWVCADLALMIAGHRSIPVPMEFSESQAHDLLREADLCLATPGKLDAPHLAHFPRGCRLTFSGKDLFKSGGPDLTRELRPRLTPGATDLVKAIHTSGTTSRPKGVLLSFGAIDAKTDTLSGLIRAAHRRRYLSLVPMSLLLEQICGIYLILSSGGTLVLLPPGTPPLIGGEVEPGHLLPFLAEARPTFTVMPPALVESMKAFAEERPWLGNPGLSTALFGSAVPPLIACGGAPIDESVLVYLASRGIPVYEGYGLSENASVVSWNLPGRARLGTVGQPFPDCEVRLAEDKQLLVRSPTLFKGYQGTDPGSCVLRPDGFLETGDLAEIDEGGFIRITGRKKQIIINKAGRNVSADWVEAMLIARPGIRAVAVFGDGLPFLVAIVIPRAGWPAQKILGAVRRANAELPDFAQVRNIALALMNDSEFLKYFTRAGRPRRPELIHHFRTTISRLCGSTHPDL
jgi:long-chain acyl-CoA synthetase